MAGIIIPTTPGLPLYSQRVTLEGVEYVFKFDYHGRQDRWYLSIEDTDGVKLADGIKLIVNWPLLRKRHHNAALPPGELFVVDTTGQGKSPGLNDLGETIDLVYHTAAELIP